MIEGKKVKKREMLIKILRANYRAAEVRKLLSQTGAHPPIIDFAETNGITRASQSSETTISRDK